MEIPRKAQDLLEMIQTYSELQSSKQVMVTFKSLSEKFTIDELDLAEKFLLKNGFVLGIDTKQMPSLNLSSCIDKREEVLKGPYYKEAEIDLHAFSSWSDDAIRIYNLGNVEIANFFPQESILIIGDKKIKIRPSGNEFELCKVIFKYKVNNWVDWSEVCEEMTGDNEIKEIEKSKRKVYDTCNRLNKRIEKELGIENFIIWEGNTLKRRL